MLILCIWGAKFPPKQKEVCYQNQLNIICLYNIATERLIQRSTFSADWHVDHFDLSFSIKTTGLIAGIHPGWLQWTVSLNRKQFILLYQQTLPEGVSSLDFFAWRDCRTCKQVFSSASLSVFFWWCWNFSSPLTSPFPWWLPFTIPVILSSAFSWTFCRKHRCWFHYEYLRWWCARRQFAWSCSRDWSSFPPFSLAPSLSLPSLKESLIYKRFQWFESHISHCLYIGAMLLFGEKRYGIICPNTP